MREHMSSSSDKRFKDLDYHIKEWYRTVSRIATKLLRGHGYQQKYLRRESDGLSARWSALCNAIQHDHHYYGHPSTAQVTIAESCLPLSNMEAMSIRGISLGFECSEYGHSKHDAHHKKGGIGHIWPIRDGSDACHDISERNGGVLYIKAIGGHINWNALGRKDMVRAYHQDHHFSIYDPIFRDLNYFPGPAMWHSAPEIVSNSLRDAIGERAILCGGPNRNDPGAKEAGCAPLNDLKIDQQATTQGLDHESIWSTFPTYSYDKGNGATCSIKLGTYGATYVDGIRIWVTGAMRAVFSSDILRNRILESVRLKDGESLWTNPNAQWDGLIQSGWMARWVTLHGRPMEWGKESFDASGMPIHAEPVDEDPRKRVERGGTGTKVWLLGHQAETPVFAPKSTMIQGAKAQSDVASSSLVKFEFAEPDVVATPVGSTLSDHLKSPLGGELKSPPEPRESEPKRLRDDSEEKAKYSRSEWEAGRTAESLKRLEAPPAFPPKRSEETAKAGAQAMAKAVLEVQAMTDEQVLDEYAQIRTRGTWDKGPELPDPTTAPTALGPEEPSRPVDLPT